jgi:uncharacterized protein
MLIVLYGIGFLVFIGLTQSVYVFPGAFFSLFQSKTRRPKTLPSDVESIFIETSDHKKLEVWRLSASDHEPSKYVAIIFHGNGGTLENFFLTQLFFQELGITSYGFDYRGYGKSSGWPNEKGLEIDSDTLWQYVINRENISPQNIIILGVSLGSALATRIASIHQPDMLILVSGFTDLRSVVNDNILTKIFSPLVYYKLQTIKYIKNLKTTKLILLCASKDTTVRPWHSDKLEAAYTGDKNVIKLICNESGHNGVFYSLRHELKKAITANMI